MDLVMPTPGPSRKREGRKKGPSRKRGEFNYLAPASAALTNPLARAGSIAVG